MTAIAAKAEDISVDMRHAGWVVKDLIDTINTNRQYLSEIDGAIGDGDHGINMSKGFSQCGERIAARGETPSLALAFDDLAMTLMEGIGGSMGPLYGSFFLSIAETLEGHQKLDKTLFLTALSAGIDAVQTIGEAKVGDKTLMDTLAPARSDYQQALDQDRSFQQCLEALAAGAQRGMLSTRDLQARIGRASRLGERSIGALDAGACSCYLILDSIARSLTFALETGASK